MVKVKIFYKPVYDHLTNELLWVDGIVGMSDGEVSFSKYPYIEKEFDFYPHALDNFEIKVENGQPVLVINEVRPPDAPPIEQ